jgi:hypothetical protein
MKSETVFVTIVAILIGYSGLNAVIWAKTEKPKGKGKGI